MARAQPDKRREARRLVEEEGLSLAEAAAQVGSNDTTVRRWQKADEIAGNGWHLTGESAVQKARSDAMTDEQRKANVERARRASLAWSEARRRDEAAAAGVLAQQLRVQAQNALPHYARSLLEENSDNDTQGARSQRIAAGIKSMVVNYAIALDKADGLAGFGKSGLLVEAEPPETADDVDETVALLSVIRDRRAARSG